MKDTSIRGTEAVRSPCIKVCQLNSEQICLGCGRSLEEIANWGGADAGAQRQIADRAARRLSIMQASTTAGQS